MAHSTSQPLPTTREAQVHQRHASRGGPVLHFVRNFVEMCAAMCIGEAILDALMLWTAASFFGYADPLRQIPAQFPEPTALVIAFNMSLPMAAWMRFRGMDWAPITEMSGAMFVLATVVIGLSWIGIVEKSSLYFWLEGLMMPAMLVPMFLRLDTYTGRTAHLGHTG